MLKALRANARLNGVGERVACVLLEAADVTGAFPLVLANLLAESHVTHAPVYRRTVNAGGHLILGGILADEAARVQGTLAEHSFALVGDAEVDGWVALQFRG